MVVGDRVEAPATGRWLELHVDHAAFHEDRWEVFVAIGHGGSSTAQALGVPLASRERAVALAEHLRAQLAHDFRTREAEREERARVIRAAATRRAAEGLREGRT